MQRKTKFPLLLCLIFIYQISFGQQTPFFSWYRLKIRKAFETKSGDDDKPGIVSFTSPKEGDNSFLVNAGLGYKLFPIQNGLGSINTFFVYNYNTLIAKKQQNYKFGFSSSTNTPIKNFELNGSHNVQYLKDYVDTNNSFLATTNWSLYSKRTPIKFDGYAYQDKKIDYFIHLSPGLEYQNLSATKQKTTSTKSDDFRVLASVGLNLLLRTKPDSISNRFSRHRFIEFIIRYDYRKTISSTIENNETEKTLFKAGVNIYPAKTEDFSVGLSYNDGQNPTDGTKKQTFLLLAVQFKLN